MNFSNDWKPPNSINDDDFDDINWLAFVTIHDANIEYWWLDVALSRM